jgi:succinate dehydrogenase / fumarate reductase flavoprotein subunit
VQARMSDKAGGLCFASDVHDAYNDAKLLSAQIRDKGIVATRDGEVVRVLQWQQMALASEAVLAVLDHYISNGGGSRGARAICDPDGDCLPQSAQGPIEAIRFRSEKDEHKDEQLIVRMVDHEMVVSSQSIRRFDEDAKSFFERDWPAWLTGEIFNLV